MRPVRVFRALLAFAVFAAIAAAQSDVGSIGGFVRDPPAVQFPRPKLSSRMRRRSEEHKTVTNDSGYYTVTNLPPSFYAVTVEPPDSRNMIVLTINWTPIRLFRSTPL